MYKKRLIATTVSIFALGVVFGIFSVEYDTFSFRALFGALAVFSTVFTVASCYFKDNINIKRVSAVALAVAAFSFGVLRVTVYNSFEINTSQFDGENDIAEFKVSEVNTYYADAYVITSDIGVPKGELVRVYADEFSDTLISGDRFYADVKYNFSDSRSTYAEGISLTASATIKSYETGNGLFYRLRQSVSQNSVKLYEGFTYAPAISKAAVVGDRSSLDSYIYSLYNSSGLSHVLAISGLHVSLFSLNLYTFLMILAFRQKFVCVFCSLTAIGYASLVGFTAGAVRACFVFIFLMLFRLFKRRSDEITALFISLALLVLINPYSLWSVSLQLSYLCSLGIILAHPILAKIQMFFNIRFNRSEGIIAIIYRLLSALVTPIFITFAATIFSFPIICTKFDTISYISPLINVFAVSLFSYAIGFAIVAFLVAPICLPLAKIISYPAGMVFDLITNLARKIHEAEIGTMSVHVPYMFVPVILSVIMIAVLVFLSRRRVQAFACVAVLFCLSLYGCWVLNDTYIAKKSIIEYGNGSGEYVYFQTPDSNVYVDIGGYSSVTDAVYKNGCVALDKYILVDYSQYSLKRFDRLSGSMKVQSLYVPDPITSYEMDIYLQIKELANSRNCDIIHYDSVCVEEFTNESYVEVYNDMGQTVIRAGIMGKSVVFVGGDFGEWIDCDVAVALNDYKSDGTHINAYDIYASDDYLKSGYNTEHYFSRFKDTLRIEMYNQEGQIKIYEP